MKLSRDHNADAMYIELRDKPVIRTKQVNFNFILDLDENDQVIGIEVLNVRKSGIDPLTLITQHYTEYADGPLPAAEAIRQGRKEKMETLKRLRQKEPQSTK